VNKVRGLPNLRFVKRRNLGYSFTGEKVTAEQLRPIFAEAHNRFPQLHSETFLTCFPSRSSIEQVPHYRLVCVHGKGVSTPAQPLVDFVEARLGEVNAEYRSKVQSRRLGRMTFERITTRDFIRRMVRCNPAMESQFKFMPLYPTLWESLEAS
jgi:hypothetical protein